MAVERQVIAANIKKLKVKEYLSKEVEKAGIGSIDIQRTPMDTRVIIHAQRPGIVIGKKGTTIKMLTSTLRETYHLDNPQIEVNDLAVPALSAPVMARSIASSLERGFHFRRAAYSALRDIMNAGAIGAHITLSGKLTGERSRMEKFIDGYIKYCGEPADRLVLKGFAEAAVKLGRIGVQVKILPPGAKMPDNIQIISEKPEEPAPPEKPVETKSAEAPKKEEKKTDKAPKAAEKDLKKPKPDAKEAVEKPKAPAEKKEKPKAKAKAVKADIPKPAPAAENDILAKPAKEIVKAAKTLGAKDLKAILKAEQTGKKRKTVIEAITKLISKEQ
ncbi:MAG TPA: 30S ribosomal protein S3 [Euryarchaeota archaeon]|nr:30S ribosomal protein S3 [archaeon BMS3Abin16]GBE56222.1 30S ribosomal protein S3 [archaeon BMS3Bbin16]HDH28803.1 30S ribosomal protein S3 [Euryarchaeota archaeon]HDY73714.1 30S ribosomal protein S3 [Euryarchaeota archaeon]